VSESSRAQILRRLETETGLYGCMYGYWTVLISKLHLLALHFLSNKEGLHFEVCSGYFYYLPYGRTSLLYTCYLLEPYFIDSQWCVFYQLARIAAKHRMGGDQRLYTRALSCTVRRVLCRLGRDTRGPSQRPPHTPRATVCP
jgi:hypothetical protein